MISAIVCIDRNFGIGYRGNLLAKIPEDMKRFRELTTGNIVVMGRATYDSLPVKPLKDRQNIIITHDINSMKYGNRNVIPVDMLGIKQMLSSHDNEREHIYIIGGGQIYKELINYCDNAYVTIIDKEFDNVDTYFPNLNKLENWKIESETMPEISSNGEYFMYRTYVKA